MKYYLSALLLLLFKIPPKKEDFRRMGASLAKRGHMRLYERLIDSYDKGILLYTHKNTRNATFTGSGFSAGVINSYRKLEFTEKTLFEKIYFNNRKRMVSFFRDYIQPQLLEHGVNTAKLVRISEGNKLFAAYFEYFDLEALEPEEYLEKATDIAAQIAHIKLDTSTRFPENRKEHYNYTFENSVTNLKDELISQVPDIDSFLTEVGLYIDQNVEKCLNHGDLSDKNAFKGGKVIDWDNFGYYPVGYDFGLIIGLAPENELTLKKYLQIEDNLYKKVSRLISRDKFELSLPYFTSVFMRSYRVRIRFEKEDWNKEASRELIALLKKRYHN